MWELEILSAVGHWMVNNGFTILLFAFLTIIVTLLNYVLPYVSIKIEQTNAHLHHIQKELEAINLRKEEANGYLYHILKEIEVINPRPAPTGQVSGVWYRCTNDPDEKLQFKLYSTTGIVQEDNAREDAEQNCQASFSGKAYGFKIMFKNGALKETG